MEKLKEGKKAATTTASKLFKLFEAKIFAIEEKLRKFCGFCLRANQNKDHSIKFPQFLTYVSSSFRTRCICI